MELRGQLLPWLIYPWERTLLPIKYGVGWAPETVWTVLKKKKFLLPLPGYESQTVQLAGGCYTNCYPRFYTVIIKKYSQINFLTWFSLKRPSLGKDSIITADHYWGYFMKYAHPHCRSCCLNPSMWIELPYFSDYKTHFFFSEKCDLKSTCVLYAESKYLFPNLWVSLHLLYDIFIVR